MAPELRLQSPRRVTLVANELRGFYPAGGMGTATTFLALALARMGHSVELLLGWQPGRPLDPYWGSVYAQAGIRIQRVQESGERVEPAHFGVLRNIELALRADPPEVVIVHDLSAPAYAALRLRQAGVALENSLFVVFCHGTRRWIMDMSRKVGVKDLRSLLAVSGLERASVELADIVVSPSAYLVGWMRDQGWSLPERTLVIPYFTRSGATGEAAPTPPTSPDGDHVRRLAFFGRLEDKKGLRPFVSGLNALDPDLVRGLDLEFVGKPTATWTQDRVEDLISDTTKDALQSVSFAAELDQHEALARLSRPGTLAVMPSLGDNSPNTVYECLEHRIPFIASNAGGIPELVDPDDRARVLVEPTSEGVEGALRVALSAGRILRPARPAFNSAESCTRWAEVIEMAPRPRTRPAEGPVDVVVQRRSKDVLPSCLAALQRQKYPHFRVIECQGKSVEEARAAGLRAGTAPYVTFLDEADVPEEELLTTLVRAQSSTGADVVTCAMRLVHEQGGHALRFFSGEPGGLGALSNDYGGVALFRRSLLGDLAVARPGGVDPDWPLLAGLAVSGAEVVSVPVPLVTRTAPPGSVDSDPAAALLVLDRLESALPDSLRSIVRLAAGLEARSPDAPAGRSAGFPKLARRAVRRLVRRGAST